MSLVRASSSMVSLDPLGSEEGRTIAGSDEGVSQALTKSLLEERDLPMRPVALRGEEGLEVQAGDEVGSTMTKMGRGTPISFFASPDS